MLNSFRLLPINKEDKLKKLIFFFCFGLFLVGAPLSTSAFGASPPEIRVDNVLRGEVVEKKIVLTRINPGKATRVNVIVDEILQPLLGYKEKEIVLPAGEYKYDFIAMIDTRNSSIGSYKGKINFQVLSDEENPEKQQFLEGAQAAIDINVTSEAVENFSFIDPVVDYDVEKKVVSVRVIADNQSNQSHYIENLGIKIFTENTEENIFSKREEINSKCEIEEKCEIKSAFNVELSEGQYLVQVDIKELNENRKIFENQVIKIEKAKKRVNRNFAYATIAVIVALVIIMCGFVWKKIKKKK